jgi:hypothetical protein
MLLCLYCGSGTHGIDAMNIKYRHWISRVTSITL